LSYRSNYETRYAISETTTDQATPAFRSDFLKLKTVEKSGRRKKKRSWSAQIHTGVSYSKEVDLRLYGRFIKT